MFFHYLHVFSLSVCRGHVLEWRSHVMQIWAGSVKPPIVLEGMYSLIQRSLSLSISHSLLFSVCRCPAGIYVIHPANSYSVQEWAEHTSHTHRTTHTLLRSVNRWSFVMGLQSLSRSAMLAACHAMPHVSVIRVALTGKPHG